MAHDVIYVNSQSELVKYQFDFGDEESLSTDSALTDIGSGSTITAYDSAGTDKSSTVLSSKTRTAMILSVKIGAVTDGEDYRVEFVGKGATSSNVITKVLEVRARRYVQGAS
jgi:hypothetical protein